jgi:hypothetical protein
MRKLLVQVRCCCCWLVGGRVGLSSISMSPPPFVDAKSMYVEYDMSVCVCVCNDF